MISRKLAHAKVQKKAKRLTFLPEKLAICTLNFPLGRVN